MRRSLESGWWKLVVAVVTLPLLATSCVEVAERSVINGFFGATTPLLDTRFESCLTESLEDLVSP